MCILLRHCDWLLSLVANAYQLVWVLLKHLFKIQLHHNACAVDFFLLDELLLLGSFLSFQLEL